MGYVQILCSYSLPVKYLVGSFWYSLYFFSYSLYYLFTVLVVIDKEIIFANKFNQSIL